MNRFLDYIDLYGRVDADAAVQDLQDFFNLAENLRHRMGRQGYLLDQYLSMLLQGAMAEPLYSAAERGFMVSVELRQLCTSAMEGREDCLDHPLYDTVKKYIETHPLDFQERSTRISLYHIALFSDFIPFALERYCRQQKEMQRNTIDMVHIWKLHDKISGILGSGTEVDRLDQLIQRCFLKVTPVEGFRQGLMNDLLFSLNSQDVETGKNALQLSMAHSIYSTCQK